MSDQDAKLLAVLTHNKEVVAKREVLLAQIDSLPKIQAPCAWCPLDGEFRCSACAEADFAGFNKRDWY
jgi:hypothetical protein